MKKKSAKKQTKNLAKKLSVQEAKELVKEKIRWSPAEHNVEEDMTEDLNEEIKKNGIEELNLSENKAVHKYLCLHNLNNHSLLTFLCHKNYLPFVTKFAEDLKKEYDCKTPSEKALVQLTVNAYYRVLRSGEMLNKNISPEGVNHQLNHYLGMLSKELDRANRQFLSALQTLRYAKRPEIKMNIKSENAYVAQNQQINNPAEPESKPTNPNQDDIIDQQ